MEGVEGKIKRQEGERKGGEMEEGTEGSNKE